REAFCDGWFRTGDVGFRDADGYLFLVDRTKDVIMRGGYSVYPRQVEDALYEHPAVSEAAVVGVPDELLGEEVVAVVVPRAALVSQRTVELFRALGLQGEIEAAAAAEFVQNGAIMSVESLGGKELEWYFRSINEGVEDLSPAPRLFVTQIGLEPILRKHA